MTHKDEKRDSDFPGFAAAKVQHNLLDSLTQWKIILIEEDMDVSSGIQELLRDLTFEDRSILVLIARNHSEARSLLLSNPDIAIVCLTLVKDRENECIDFVRDVREELDNPLVRVLVRTQTPQEPATNPWLAHFDFSFHTCNAETGAPSPADAAVIISALRTFRDLVTLEKYASDMQRMNADYICLQEQLEESNARLERELGELESTRAALLDSKNWLEALLGSVEEGIIATDWDGRVALINPLATKMTGRSATEAKGQPIDMVFCLESPHTAPISRNGGMGTGALDKHTTSEVLVSSNGRKRSILLSYSPILAADEQEEGQIYVFWDMTDYKKSEAEQAQRQKLESLGTLASGIAHEIRNPLTVILNASELLQKKFQNDEKITFFTSKILSETERVAKIVSNMLSFARQEAFEKELESARIEDIIEEALSLVHATMRCDDISFEIDIPSDLPSLRCHPQQIQQVLINLLTNARDALRQIPSNTAHPKIIEIRCTQILRQQKRWIRTTVEDHGTGIAPEIAERIFDPFYTTKTSEGGIGLGLSVSHNIVLRHGGQLSVECQPGQYTRFHVDLLTSDSQTPRASFLDFIHS